MLSVKQAADQSGLSVRTIRHHITTGSLKAQLAGSYWIIAERDLEKWLSQERKPGPKKKTQKKT